MVKNNSASSALLAYKILHGASVSLLLRKSRVAERTVAGCSSELSTASDRHTALDDTEMTHHGGYSGSAILPPNTGIVIDRTAPNVKMCVSVLLT